MTRAAIYLRISQDRTGQAAGVARQEQDCRAKALLMGWEVAELYSDNDLSAFTGKRRPGYEALLDAIRAGRIGAVVVWDQDRLDKGGLEAEQFINLADQYKVGLASVGGDFDLSTDQGRLMYRVKGAFSRAELERKSARQKRANRQRAEQGKFHGSRRPFGYETGGVVIREVEAEAIREAFELILTGGTLGEVARRFNSAGLLTPQKGQEWTGTVVSRTLRTARMAGFKTYQGEIVRGEDGEPIKAEWPAIVDPDTWHAAQAVLSDPDRKIKFGSVHSSQLLLSGVALCGVCGAKIASGGRLKGRSRYRCGATGGRHVYREADPVDQFIQETVLRRLAEPDLVELIRTQAEGPKVDVAALRAEAAEVHARMEQMAEAFADGSVTLAQLKASNARATARLADIEARMPTDTQSAALGKLITGLDLVRTWGRLSLDARRGVVDALLTVRLLPPKTMKVRPYLYEHGMRRVNPETLVVDWR